MPVHTQAGIKKNILDYTFSELTHIVCDRCSQKPYRARQIFTHIYTHSVFEFTHMRNLPGNFRNALEKSFEIRLPLLIQKKISKDGSIKYLWQLSDGITVESVYIPEDRRKTVCFSTQAGCPVQCNYCATGAGGFRRNLSPGEITGQLLGAQKDTGERISNCVAMGQGEPLLNYKAVMKALSLINDPKGLGISARRITLSTCGIVPGIINMAKDKLPCRLAVSLHACRNTLRTSLIPVNGTYPLEMLKKALLRYCAETKNRVTFEYMLIDRVNDKREDALSLVRYLRGLPGFVNLIPYNQLDNTPLKKPDKQRVLEFLRILKRYNIEASVRAERGTDIKAACGQLTQGR